MTVRRYLAVIKFLMKVFETIALGLELCGCCIWMGVCVGMKDVWRGGTWSNFMVVKYREFL